MIDINSLSKTMFFTRLHLAFWDLQQPSHIKSLIMFSHSNFADNTDWDSGKEWVKHLWWLENTFYDIAMGLRKQNKVWNTLVALSLNKSKGNTNHHRFLKVVENLENLGLYHTQVKHYVNKSVCDINL